MTPLLVHPTVPTEAPVWSSQEGYHTVLRMFAGNAIDVAVTGDGAVSVYEWRGAAGWRLLPRGDGLSASDSTYRLVVGVRQELIAPRYFAIVSSSTGVQVWAEAMAY